MDYFSSHWFDSFASGTYICTLSVFTGTATSEFRRTQSHMVFTGELFEMKETAVRCQSLKDDSLSELVAATS